MLIQLSAPGPAHWAADDGQAPIPELEILTRDNLPRLTRIASLPYPEDARLSALAFGGNREWMVLGYTDGSLHVVGLDDHQRRAEARMHGGRITELQVSPEDPDLLASASWDTSLRLWFVSSSGLTPGRVFDVDDTHTVETLTFTSTGLNLIAGYGNNAIIGFRIADGKRSAEIALTDESFKINALATARDGSMLAAVSADGSLTLFSISEDEPVILKRTWTTTISKLRGNKRVAVAGQLAFSPTEAGYLAIGTFDGYLAVLDAARRRSIREFSLPGAVVDLSFAPDGGFLLACTDDGKTRIWDAQTWEMRKEIVHRPVSHGCAFAPDGMRIVIAEREQVAVWGVPEPVESTAAPTETQEMPTATLPPTGTAVPGGTPTPPVPDVTATPTETQPGGPSIQAFAVRLGAFAERFGGVVGGLLLMLGTMVFVGFMLRLVLRLRRQGYSSREIIVSLRHFLWNLLTLQLQQARKELSLPDSRKPGKASRPKTSREAKDSRKKKAGKS